MYLRIAALVHLGRLQDLVLWSARLVICGRSGGYGYRESKAETRIDVIHYPPPIVDRKIRFALVGCGRISANHFEALKKHHEKTQLVAVCDVDSAGSRQGRGADRRGWFSNAARSVGGQRCRHRRAGDSERIAFGPGDADRRQRAPRDDREADGNALGRRQAHGRRLRHGRSAPVRRQAEPAQRDAPVAQAGRGQGAIRPDLSCDDQRLLVSSAVLLRQLRRGVARGSSMAAPS